MRDKKKISKILNEKKSLKCWIKHKKNVKILFNLMKLDIGKQTVNVIQHF